MFSIKITSKKPKVNKSYIAETIRKSDIDIHNYFKRIKQDIKNIVFSFSNVKFQLIVKTIYSKPIEFGKKVKRFYNSGFIKLISQYDFNDVYNNLIEKYKLWQEEHQGKESGLIFYEIEKTDVKVVRVKGFTGSSYIELPTKSNSILNIKKQ